MRCVFLWGIALFFSVLCVCFFVLCFFIGLCCFVFFGWKLFCELATEVCPQTRDTPPCFVCGGCVESVYLFNCDGFCQVSWHVYVFAFVDGNVVAEQLQRY